MNNIPLGIQNEPLVYMDDIIVYSPTIHDHFNRQKIKICRKNLDRPLVLTETPRTPFEIINIDILEGPSRNYAPAIREKLKRFSQAYTMPDKSTKTVVVLPFASIAIMDGNSVIPFSRTSAISLILK